MDHIISIPLSPEMFLKAQIALDDTAGVTHTGDDKAGTVVSHDLDFSYTYDGATLAMTITGRHTLKAKLASDEQIKAHIQAMFGS